MSRLKPRNRPTADQEHVALAELRQGVAKLNAICFGSAGSLPPNFRGTGRAQSLHLRVNALTIRRYPCIAQNHGPILLLYYAPEKLFPIKGLFEVHNF